MQTVKITIDVLYGIKFLLDELKSSNGDEPSKETIYALIDILEDKINSKIESHERRELFTRYKTSEQGSNERENLRNEYLDLIGIHKDWRSTKEQISQ
jgi:hypothetical protein